MSFGASQNGTGFLEDGVSWLVKCPEALTALAGRHLAVTVPNLSTVFSLQEPSFVLCRQTGSLTALCNDAGLGWYGFGRLVELSPYSAIQNHDAITTKRRYKRAHPTFEQINAIPLQRPLQTK